jgi:hypothetical protein
MVKAEIEFEVGEKTWDGRIIRCRLAGDDRQVQNRAGYFKSFCVGCPVTTVALMTPPPSLTKEEGEGEGKISPLVRPARPRPARQRHHRHRASVGWRRRW